MLSKEQASRILTWYTKEVSETMSYRGRKREFLNLHTLLQAIANGDKECTISTPHYINDGIWPVTVAKYYPKLVKQMSEKEWGAELFEKNQELKELFKRLKEEVRLESPKILFYKSKDGEFSVKFPSQAMRNNFLTQLKAEQIFPSTNRFLAREQFIRTYSDNNDTLYIPAYTAGNGELAACFPSVSTRNKFVELLEVGSELASTYSGQDALYINDRSIHQMGSNIAINIPAALSLGLSHRSEQAQMFSSGESFFTATSQQTGQSVPVYNPAYGFGNGDSE